MRPIVVLALAAGLALPAAHAQSPAAHATPTPQLLETAVVRVPGPGMWQVRRGEHALWILGTVSPLPAGMAWNSARVRGVIAQADAVIAPPSVTVGADIGFFGKLALLPSLVGVRSLPGDRRLADVVPAADYARWAALKQRYIGRDGSVERWRPMFAGFELYEKAIRTVGLSGRNVVGRELEAAMKSRGLKAVRPAAKITVANPKKAIREFKVAEFADLECFRRTLDQVEADLPALAARADAWARGDIDALRPLRHQDLVDVCERALLGGRFASSYGMDRLEAEARAKWIAQVESSLSKHRVTFATLPMREVLSSDGLVAALAAKGYVVEPPAGDAAP
ncbi:MAG TPA: TraB/GumN family protein [Lysobacter sp.]